LPRGTRNAEIGRAVGEMVGGTITFLTGMAGLIGGGALAYVGGPSTAQASAAVIAKAGVLAAGGIANMGGGIAGLAQALTTGSGSSSSPSGSSSVEQISPSEFAKTHRINTNSAKYKARKADIAQNGIREPVKYVELNGKKYVVDGHHRVRIARELGFDSVPAERVQLPYKGYKTIDDLF
jgi:hypothetical protein